MKLLSLVCILFAVVVAKQAGWEAGHKSPRWAHLFAFVFAGFLGQIGWVLALNA